MAQNSNIEWTHHTGNLWWGCTKVHRGCDNCYAEAFSQRYGHQVWGKDAPRMATKSVWSNFLKWNALAHAAGETHRVFVGSMMDIFEKPMPMADWHGAPLTDSAEGYPVFSDTLRERFFNDIVPACGNLDFLLLTKRPSNINKMIPKAWLFNPPKNVMFGTSPVDQDTFDNLVRQLSKVNGRLFLSIEPQLEMIVPHPDQLTGIDWIIQGGESGPKRRPFSLHWAHYMRDLCAALAIPYFFKQVDKIAAIPADLQIRQFPT